MNKKKRVLLLDRSDKKFILLMVLMAIFVTVIAVLFILGLSGKMSVIENITLVKDYQNMGGRLISDKTDFLSNTQGDINLKADIPNGYIDPNSVSWKEEENQNKGEVINYKITSQAGNPLDRVEPGSVVEIIGEEEIIPNYEPDPTTLEMLLELARQRRNLGRIDTLKRNLVLVKATGFTDDYNDLYSTNGAIILPFRVEWDNFEYLSKFTELYNRYHNRINFIYMNVSSAEVYSENPKNVWLKFEEYNIPNDVPLYYNRNQSLVTSYNITKNTGYLIINKDGYIYKRDWNMFTLANLESDILMMMDENIKFEAEDEQIILDYEAGYYDDLDLTNLHWNDRTKRFENLTDEMLMNDLGLDIDHSKDFD